MKHLGAVVCGVALAAVSGASHASFHTFQIEQVYSNADGTIQYVMLHETAGFDGEGFLAGHTLTSTHAGVTKTYTFVNDLPSMATSGKRLLIATRGFADLATKAQSPMSMMPPKYYYPPPPPPPPPPPNPPVMSNGQPDYIIPDGFLATDGGTINYAGVDQLTYDSLPTDGLMALERSGPSQNTPINFAGVTTPLMPGAVTLVEFYNTGLDHYFVSALQPDIDALDSGRIAGWTRTGLSFKVFPTAFAGGAGVNGVCRFLIPPQHGNSHFFSASPDECAAVANKVPVDPNYSGYILETGSAFFVALPDTTTGACPAGTVPVFRLFNNRADANHRYTADPSVQATMMARGYVAEGYGPNATIMCAPA